MKLINKKIIVIIIILFALFNAKHVVFGSYVEVTGKMDRVAIYSKFNVETGSDGFPISLATYIGQIIQYILTTLGVIFLALLIFAGFVYMTARGDTERVQEAKDIMHNVVIGLIIILMSYAASVYVVGKVAQTTVTTSGFN